MSADFGLPIQLNGSDRDEILVVYFDGFIKNETEGVIREILKDMTEWSNKYKNLEAYLDMSSDEIYHETMLFRPFELLNILSDYKLSKEEIEGDINSIIPNINFANLTLTTFEFALYKILQESNITKCYIFKDTDFFDNEVNYVRSQYKDCINKIEFASGGLLNLFDDVKPTTLFVTNPILPINIFHEKYKDEELSEKIFIILNSSLTIQYDEEHDMFYYTEKFLEEMNKVNDEYSYGLLAMFNFPLLDDSDETENEEQTDEE